MKKNQTKSIGKKKTKSKKEDYLDHIIKEVALSINPDPIYYEVIKELMNKSNYSEYELAEKLNVDIRTLRKILYVLFENGLLFWRRKKDRQKGWYIYYWTVKDDEFPFFYKRVLEKRLKKLQEKLEKEESTKHFICPNLCLRVDYLNAIELNFTCPECGAVLVEQDNKRTIKNIKEQIKHVKEELKKLEKSDLLKNIAKKYDEWYSSGNLFAKTKRRKTEQEIDFFDALMNEIMPKEEIVFEDFGDEE